MVRQSAAPAGVQTSISDLGTPLAAATFVVLDLETTGTSASAARVTEVGAVRVRGGEVLGEFSTLVDPGVPVPAAITLLTGITQSMVATAPPMEEVLPRVLAFLDEEPDTVLVAHNAAFDTGFLKAACERHGSAWPGYPVVDTLRLARAILPRSETRNHRLATLAAFFGVPVTPNHRALDDARATVGVLHGLIERLGPMGVTSVEELRAVSKPASRAQKARRHLAEGLPEGPGVYVFTDARGAMTGDPAAVVSAHTSRIAELAGALRYEEAAALRDRLAAFLRGARRAQRLSALASVAQVVASRRSATGWETCVVRHGRLAASAVLRPGTDPTAFLASLLATAEYVPPGYGPSPRALPAETELVLDWLTDPATRLVDIDGVWT
ncbi:exonuclease domain-containing protein, partial [Nocardiopsis tropica]|nr:exonuclease domain-containing protein [Nocardiopsis tropica]